MSRTRLPGRKTTPGGKDVQVVGGPNVTQQLLRAGLVDELHIDVMPVLFGKGRRLLDFDQNPSVRLEKQAVQEAGQRTGLRYRIVK
jgi:dihydrofolate reductase